MSKKELVAMIETMNNYDDLAAKAKARADAIRDALKEEMLRLDTEELTAGAYISAIPASSATALTARPSRNFTLTSTTTLLSRSVPTALR